MTDISVFTVQEFAEDLSWDLSSMEVPYVASDTLDVSLWDAATHYPNGFLPSGLILGRKTSGGLIGPYLDSLANGQQTAVGILRASIQVVQPNGALKTKIGIPRLDSFAVVSISRLPVTSVSAPLGGFIDAAGQTDLKFIRFVA